MLQRQPRCVKESTCMGLSQRSYVMLNVTGEKAHTSQPHKFDKKSKDKLKEIEYMKEYRQKNRQILLEKKRTMRGKYNATAKEKLLAQINTSQWV